MLPGAYDAVFPYDWISCEDLAYMYGLFALNGSIDVSSVFGTVRLANTSTARDILSKRGQLYEIGMSEKDSFIVLRAAAGNNKAHNDLYEFFKRVQGLVGFESWIFGQYEAPNFLEGLVHANTDDGVISATVISIKRAIGRERADQLQLVAMAAGWCADIIINQRECYVTLRRDIYVAPGSYTLLRREFKGHVYCIEVPNHVFLARVDGKCVWTGNSSRHGQKGTVGMMYAQHDMPWGLDGTVPDMIINPHAIPSRMTIAQLMECLMGKACCALGTYGDATPFTDLTVEDIAKELQKCGLEKYGNEIMYNSRSGEQIGTLIFTGPTYYQKLKHMVAEKVHSRAANGPVVLLTRQPAEGRARDGGLRLGEMEVECHLAHGISSFLKERFMECSDNYRVFVCKKCGMMANVNPEEGIYSCKPCNNTTNFSEIRLPYAAKLLLQEIQTMSIATRFITQ